MKSLKGTRTEKNLLTAFAGESVHCSFILIVKVFLDIDWSFRLNRVLLETSILIDLKSKCLLSCKLFTIYNFEVSNLSV